MARLTRSTETPTSRQSSVWHQLTQFLPRFIFGIVSAVALVATAPSVGAAVRPSPKTQAGVTTTPTTRTSHSVSASVRSFGWLASTTPPITWTKLAAPSRLGILSSPPGFRTVEGDRGSLSLALLSAGGTYLGYLNVTPRQGNETLRDWAAFRLSHLLRDDATSVHKDGMVSSLRTANGARSCVTDDYVTTIGHHHFHEVACYVIRNSVSGVVIGATPSGDPAHVWSELETAIAAYPLA